jgi:hypothetical protein
MDKTPLELKTPPPVAAELVFIVCPEIEPSIPLLKIPPPFPVAVLLEIFEFTNALKVPALEMPPPVPVAVLNVMLALAGIVIIPAALRTPPPLTAELANPEPPIVKLPVKVVPPPLTLPES